jgi:hypothetical protein
LGRAREVLEETVTTLIRNVKIFDGEVLQDGEYSVLVDGDRIASIVAAGSTPKPVGGCNGHRWYRLYVDARDG